MDARRLSVEAVVLRSMRYGEADRILHAVTPEHGRVSAIAKGARRPRSKLGGRLEPLSAVRLELQRGRGDLMTVVGADTLVVHHRLLTAHAALETAQRAALVVDRVCVPDEPAERVHGLLRTLLALLDEAPDRGGEGMALAFELKLLYALGLQPVLTTCAACGRPDGLAGFDPVAGGVVCSACRRGAPPIGAAAVGFMLEALGRPLAEAPALERPAAGEVERALTGLAAEHLGVDLRRRG
jgi:DNA repair protein RecO (recombination protein O)